MKDDIEVWLLFAPFWLLGTFAILGALWHLVHFVIVHGQALAIGQTPSPFRVRNWQELPHASRYHLKRAGIAMLAFVGFAALGVVVGVLWALWRA